MEVPVEATHQHQSGEFVQVICEAVDHITRVKLVVCAHYKTGYSEIEVHSARSFATEFRKLKKLKVVQHIPAFVDVDGHKTTAVESLAEVEELEWIKRWTMKPGFIDFRLGVRDGDRATLMAVFHSEVEALRENLNRYFVVAFLSGDFDKLQMLQRWKQWNTDAEGRLID
jgi:hypothetical protein